MLYECYFSIQKNIFIQYLILKNSNNNVNYFGLFVEKLLLFLQVLVQLHL